MLIKSKLKNIFLFSIILQYLFISFSFSEIIKSFDIQGNDRVSKETIIMFSNLKIGETLNQNKLNEALKELYYTDYFKNVKIKSNNNVVKIVVKENPIIQQILIKGIEKNRIKEQLKEITSKLCDYSCSKAAQETLFKYLQSEFKDIKFFSTRLPRLKTDQTQTIFQQKTKLPYPYMLKLIKKFSKI